MPCNDAIWSMTPVGCADDVVLGSSGGRGELVEGELQPGEVVPRHGDGALQRGG